jgi:hypothetical protein
MICKLVGLFLARAIGILAESEQGKFRTDILLIFARKLL